MAKRSREVEKLVKVAEDAGWKVKTTSSGWQLRSPDGVSKATVHRSGGSDPRSIRNFRADLRRGWPDGLPGCP